MTNQQIQQTVSSLLSTRKKVIFRAPMLSMSGYGTHARQIASWLLKRQEKIGDIDLHFEVLQWGITPWHVDHSACDGLIGKIIQNCRKSDSGYDVSFQLQLPNEWDPFLAPINVGITAAVETDRCNPDWISAVNRMDLVIVPSKFTKGVFENTCALEGNSLDTPIAVIPESWIEACRGASRSKSTLNLPPLLDTDFNFLVVSQFTGNNPLNDRKNLAFTLKWLLEEFKDEPNVGVIIKTNFGRQTQIDKQHTLKTLSQITLECRQGVGPRVHVMHGHMTDEEIVGLYTHPKVKAFVSLSRGEGFGLPLLEAAACGLPVVATGWSAHTEFLGLGKYVKVDYTLSKIHESRVDGKIFVPEAQWATVEEKDAKRKLGRIHKNASIPTEWAAELQKTLQKSHSPEAVEQIYNDVAKEHNLL